MSEPGPGTPPPWWRVEDRRAARQAERAARRQERAADRGERRAARHGEPGHEPVTPESIADAALRVIDEQGLDGLTVRALAQQLGVGTMTLYWYVRNKDEVLDLVADRLLAGIEVPSDEPDWRISARQVSIAVRSALLRHPKAVAVLVGRGSTGPNALELVEKSIGLFRRAGFSDDDAADAYFTTSNYVTGFCTQETANPDLAGTGVDRSARSQAMRNYFTMLPPDRFPNMIAAAPRMFGGNPDDRFAFGVDCLIAGLESKLPRTEPAAR